MAIFEINTQPSDRQVRQFGGLCLFALPLIVWLWTRSLTAAGWASAIGTIIGLTGILSPSLIRPLFVGMVLLTFPIGLVVGELLLLLMFLLVFVPMAIIFRLMGRDALMLKRRSGTKTFWVKRTPINNVRRYYQQW